MLRFLRGRAGRLACLCALPVLLLGALVPANRYEADGFAGVDCVGPFHVLLFAVPALLLYGTAAIANSLRHHGPMQPLVALGCTLACAALAVNAADAIAHLRRNATENAGSCEDNPWPPRLPKPG